jgi:hypothetical protein
MIDANRSRSDRMDELTFPALSPRTLAASALGAGDPLKRASTPPIHVATTYVRDEGVNSPCPGDLLRLSAGLEDPDDLYGDLLQAPSFVTSSSARR